MAHESAQARLGRATIGDLNFECDFTATSPANDGNLYQVMNNLDGNRTQNFVYDPLNRIQTAYTSGPNWGEAYTIDAWGNLTAINSYQGKPYENLNCGPANSKNQLNTCYGYDAAGNLQQNGSELYTYDAENRLITAGGVTYTYDGDGRRVMKSNGTIYWRGVGDDVLAESNLSGTISEEYAYPNGKRMVRMDRPSGKANLYFSDLVGSATMITDIDGNPEKQSDYYPYGGEIPISGTDPNHYKFTGKERDAESGLDNFEARYLGSSPGRFMSPDPAGLLTQKPTYPQSWNLYAYAMNNPLIFIDPTGLDCVYANEAGNGVESIDHNSNSGECGQNGGSWAPGYVDENWAHFNNSTGMFQVGSINGAGNNATVDYTMFGAGAQTQFNGDESSCLSGCAGFSLANANWLQSQLVGNSTLGGLDGYIQFLTGREEQLHGGLLVKLAAGPLDPSTDHWAGPGGMGPPGGRGDWAASVHDYNFFTNQITMGSYFNPTLSVATSKALIQSNNKLIRNAGGIQSIKMGLFFGVANAVQWYSNSWK